MSRSIRRFPITPTKGNLSNTIYKRHWHKAMRHAEQAKLLKIHLRTPEIGLCDLCGDDCGYTWWQLGDDNYVTSLEAIYKRKFLKEKHSHYFIDKEDVKKNPRYLRK